MIPELVLTYYIKYVANNRTLNGKLLNNIGYQLRNDMLVSCKFNGKPCSACDFKMFWEYSESTLLFTLGSLFIGF